MYDKFEWYWDFYKMIIDYYTKYSDPELKVVKKELGGDNGGVK